MARDPRPSQKAVTLLATSFVMLGGLTALTFIVVTADNNPLPKVLGIAGGMFGLALLLWLLRDRPPGESIAWQFRWFRGRAVSAPVVRVAFRRPAAPETPPQPPSVEHVRELSQNVNTWVPSARPRSRE